MRVLLVAGAPETDVDLVLRLAKGAQRIIAADSGAAVCARAGILPDIVVGDLDSLPAAEVENLERLGVGFERHPAHKDVSDLDLALKTAIDSGAETIVATGVIGGRLAHTIAALGSLARSRVPVTIVEVGMTGWMLNATAAAAHDVEGRDSEFSVIALDGETIVTVSGARWPLDHALVEPLSSWGISNIVVEDRATIVVHEGCVIVLREDTH